MNIEARQQIHLSYMRILEYAEEVGRFHKKSIQTNEKHMSELKGGTKKKPTLRNKCEFFWSIFSEEVVIK